MRIKLEQLLNIGGIKEIVLSTNDEISVSIAKEYFVNSDILRVCWRPEELAQSTTKLTDLISHVPSLTDKDHILWTHVTAPFAKTSEYERIIKAYFNRPRQFDSLMTVHQIRNFIWSEETAGVMNKKRNSNLKWPRTQDLTPLSEVNSVAFMYSRNGYLKDNDRIGSNPLLLEQDWLTSFDIDYPEDFRIAQKLWG